jgi:DNA-binding transcriptional MocR family regulator
MDNVVLPLGTTTQAISLLLGHPDPATLATPAFQAAVGRVMASPHAYHALEYGDEPGNPSLIAYLAARISREQGIRAQPENLMIVAGSTHAVDMAARLYAKLGGAVMVEAPTYVDSLQVFRDHGVELHAVPMDDEGVIIEAFEARLKQLAGQGKSPSLFYTIPNFHNPTGITTSTGRRLQVIRLARAYGFTIVEDDVYRDLAFEADVPPSFYALANGGGVIQIGSFSKTLAPGLRLGWVVASPETIHRFVFCGTTQMGGGANPLAAQIVADYCGQGDWDVHITDLRKRYRVRRDTMLAALERYMPPGVSWTKPAGGFFVWVTLPAGISGAVVKEQALKRGVLVAAGEGYFVHPDDGRHNLRLTYSFAPLSEMEAGVRILAEVIGG